MTGLTNMPMMFWIKRSSCIAEQGTMIIESSRKYFWYTELGLWENSIIIFLLLSLLKKWKVVMNSLRQSIDRLYSKGLAFASMLTDSPLEKNVFKSRYFCCCNIQMTILLAQMVRMNGWLIALSKKKDWRELAVAQK